MKDTVTPNTLSAQEASALLHELLEMAEAMMGAGAEVNRVEDTLSRMGVAWQNVCYNQPPHLGYYLPAAKFSADDSATDLIDDIQIEHASAYYDLSGRALKGRPTCAGIYIYNNKKVIIK